MTTLAKILLFFFFQAEDGIRDFHVTGVQTCALPISLLAGRGVVDRGSLFTGPGSRTERSTTWDGETGRRPAGRTTGSGHTRRARRARPRAARPSGSRPGRPSGPPRGPPRRPGRARRPPPPRRPRPRRSPSRKPRLRPRPPPRRRPW